MRIVIAEDSVLLRAGICRLLVDAGHEVVAEVGDAEALLDAVRTLAPAIAIVDIRMPPTFTDDGIRAAIEIRRNHADCAVLVLSQYVERHYAIELLARDTARIGYLLKERVADVSDFVAAVERVGRGGTALDAEVIAQLLATQHRDNPIERLTPRELDVLKLMAEGRSNGAIAQALVVSDGAVEKHVSNIFAKLALPPAENDHRRVLAVLRYLEGTSA